jgi:hypothetical protein
MSVAAISSADEQKIAENVLTQHDDTDSFAAYR